MKIERLFYQIIIIGLVVVLAFILYSEKTENKLPEETAIQLATTITVLRPSFLTAKDIDNFLKSTGLAGYGNAFMEAEKQSGIGADYLVSIAAHESGYGTNYWWKYWNNCFSWGITDKGPNSEAYYVKSLNKTEAIIYIAKQIKALYLTKGSTYYKGETLSAIGYYYASNGSWANNVITIHNNFVKTLPEQVLAQEWIMGSRILNGDLPSPIYYTSDYFTRPLTREEISIILWRIQNK